MAKLSEKASDEPRKLTIYTIELGVGQMEKLQAYCDKRLWEFYAVDYARFAFKSRQHKVNLVAYKSGKVVVQGKGTEDFVRDVLEAEITGEPKLGYDQVHYPEWFEAHAGLDEAGKGDLFGPLVTACVIADEEAIPELIEAGVKDSKRLGDNAVLRLDKILRTDRNVVVKTSLCGMGRYNEIMGKPGANLNQLLAWLHSRSLENALKTKRVPWGMLDQFTKKPLVQKYFTDKKFELRMQPKAEADPVVAAASIAARAEFLRQMKKLSKNCDEILLKGASREVKEQAKALVKKLGPDAFGDYAKLHFRTAYEALGLPVPEKTNKFYGASRRPESPG